MNLNEIIYAIDFETASSAFYSACSLGVVKFNKNGILSRDCFLIQPPDNFYSNKNIAIHGITPQDTCDSPFFNEVWMEIKNLFNNTCIFAHNANFDMSVLKSTLSYYGIEQPNFYYCDSRFVNKNNIPKGEKVSNGLDSLCNYFHIELENHHNALCDAEACASLVIHALNNGNNFQTVGAFLELHAGIKNYSDVGIKSESSFRFGKNIKLNDLKSRIECLKENHDADFVGKNVVITGTLSKLTREAAYEKVLNAGGNITSIVSKNTDILVNAENKMSSKLKNAIELKDKGHHIKIISDDQFMKMLETVDSVTFEEVK